MLLSAKSLPAADPAPAADSTAPSAPAASSAAVDEASKAVFGLTVGEIEKAYEGRTAPESVRMLSAIAKGSMMGSGEGWFGPAAQRYTWKWLAEKHGIAPDQPLPADKFLGTPELFARLDRNKNGFVAAEDFEWSDRHPWVQQAYVVNRLFRRIETKGNGKMTRDEWIAFFDKAAKGKEYVESEDLRDAALGGTSGFLPGDAPTQEQMIRGFFAGELGSLQEGPGLNEQAPDFTLKTKDGQAVRLGDLIGKKPVVLTFGNFTCGPFRSMYPGVETIYSRFKDDVEFLSVYVREAHPTDGWKMDSNKRVGIAVAQPRTYAERAAVATQCSALLKPSMPLVIDEINDPVGNAYSGMPARLYVIDRAGKVAYKSGRGPFGFKTGEMEQSLVMTLLDDQLSKGEEKKEARLTPEPVLYTQARVPLLANDEAWKHLPETKSGQGETLPNWALALAETLPHTAAAVLELDALCRTTPQFTARERGLIRWAAASVNRSGYGQAYASAELKAAGATDEQLKELSAGNLQGLDAREKLLEKFAKQLSRAGRDLTDDEVEAVRKAFDEDRLVGIVLLTAYANFQDRIVHALALPLEANGPLPPVSVSFVTTPGGSQTPLAARPAIPETTLAAAIALPEWSDFSHSTLQARLEQQRDRQPRLAIPTWQEVCDRLPKGLYNPNKPLRIRWSRLVVARQPQLGPAWIKCLRVFGNEAKQDRRFEESVFYVVTRELRCFYCMGHCEMLLEVGGLKADEIAVRTRKIAEGQWSEFPAAEQASYSLAARLTRSPWAVTDEDLSRTTTALGKERALDMVWWIARCQFMTKVSDAFQLQLERDNVFLDFEPPQEDAAKK